MIGPLFCAALALAAPAAGPGDAAAEPPVLGEKDRVEKDDYVLRLSLPTEEDRAAWRAPGFRLSLGYAYGWLWGSYDYTDTPAHSIVLRPAVRIDEHWSIAANASFSVTTGDLQGLRWSVTLEPTWHPIGGLSVAIGIGYAGFLAQRYDPYTRAAWGEVGDELWEPPPSDPTDAGSATRDRSAMGQEVLDSCDGDGISIVARIEYQIVVGPLFATGPFIERSEQWVDCKQGAGNTDPDTGEAVAIDQWWRHLGFGLGWWVTWR